MHVYNCAYLVHCKAYSIADLGSSFLVHFPAYGIYVDLTIDFLPAEALHGSQVSCGYVIHPSHYQLPWGLMARIQDVTKMVTDGEKWEESLSSSTVFKSCLADSDLRS